MYQKKQHGIKPWVIAATVLSAIIWLIYTLNSILMPFVVSAVLAYILNPLVAALCNKGIKRSTASMVVMIFSLLLIFALILIIVPMLINQFYNLIERIPQIVGFIQNKLLPWINSIAGKHIEVDMQSIAAWLQANIGAISQALRRATGTLVRQGSHMATGLANMLLLPFLLYYFLLDWNRWARSIRKLIPRRFLKSYLRITGNMDKVLGEFLRGQLTVMLVMGLIYGIGLALIGLDSGFAIGVIAGILVFVPYLGAFIGLLLATIAALLQFGSWQGLLSVWTVFAIGQFIESFFITPKIVGDRIGLSPFWVIFSLMAFGQLMGFTGMLIGLPLAAITLVLMREGAAVYFKSGFYRHR